MKGGAGEEEGKVSAGGGVGEKAWAHAQCTRWRQSMLRKIIESWAHESAHNFFCIGEMNQVLGL